MKLVDLFVILVVGTIVTWIVISMRKQKKKNGAGCGGCSGCSVKNCQSRK